METDPEETPEEVSPVPVAPLPAWRRILGAGLVAAVWAGVGLCAFWLVRPRVAMEWAGDEATIRVGPEMAWRQLGAIAAAVACGAMSWVVQGRRDLAGVGIVVAVLLAVAVWHQNAARVVLGPDALTAPTAGRLLPGPPATVRFDQIAMMWLSRGDRGGSRTQQCQMKDGRRIAFDLGPLLDAAAPLIERYGRERGAKVSWVP